MSNGASAAADLSRAFNRTLANQSIQSRRALLSRQLLASMKPAAATLRHTRQARGKCTAKMRRSRVARCIWRGRVQLTCFGEHSACAVDTLFGFSAAHISLSEYDAAMACIDTAVSAITSAAGTTAVAAAGAVEAAVAVTLVVAKLRAVRQLSITNASSCCCGAPKFLRSAANTRLLSARLRQLPTLC